MHDALSSLLASGVSLFGQGCRLIKLRFAESSGIGPEVLLPHKLHGEESLSQNYVYTLTIEPALSTLKHRSNSRVFQDKSVPQIVTTLLDEHLAGNPAFTGAFQYRDALTKTYVPRKARRSVFRLPHRCTVFRSQIPGQFSLLSRR